MANRGRKGVNHGPGLADGSRLDLPIGLFLLCGYHFVRHCRHRRQPMGVMNFVFPITALYFGPLAVALYGRWGRATAPVTVASMPVSMAPVTSAGDVTEIGAGRGPAHADSAGVGGAARPGAAGRASKAFVGHDGRRGEPLRRGLQPGRRDF